MCGGGHALDVGWVSCIQLLCRGVPLWLLKYIFYAINTVTQCTEHFNIPLCPPCPLWFELNYCPAPHPFFHSPAAPFPFTLPGCPSRAAPPALVVRGLAGAFRLIWVVCSERMILCWDELRTWCGCCNSTDPATAAQ